MFGRCRGVQDPGFNFCFGFRVLGFRYRDEHVLRAFLVEPEEPHDVWVLRPGVQIPGFGFRIRGSESGFWVKNPGLRIRVLGSDSGFSARASGPVRRTRRTAPCSGAVGPGSISGCYQLEG